MPHSRSWTAPPTRREITLLLFSLTIFVLSYNLEASLRIVGVRPQKLTSSYLSSIGLGTKDPGFDPDGRRPKEWRDELETIIAGDWEWREGEVSGVARGSAAASGSGRTAVIYNFGGSKKVARNTRKEDRGVSLSTGVTVKDQFIKWGKDVPETSVVAHTPGYTVLDNVIAVNGTLFVVANDWTKVPKLGEIASSSLDPTKPPRVQDWHILTTNDAAGMFGPYAAKIHGTSWLALGKAEAQDPYTLFSLFRTHASLSSAAPPASFTSSTGLHIIAPSSSSGSSSSTSPSSVPAPLRVIYPYIPTFSSPNIPPGPGEDPKSHPPPRERAYTGTHPLLPKAVLPALGVWYEEDWQDLADMHVPFLLERVVVADRGAAERGRDQWVSAADAARQDELTKREPGREGEPPWAAPFVGLHAPEGWWAPVRAALLRYLHVGDGAAGADTVSESGRGVSLWGLTKKQAARKPVVAYVSMQDEPAGAGARLAGEDHERLVNGLRALEREGVLGEVVVVRGNGSVPAHEWEARMSAIARSTILMGPYGFHLADAVFMRSPYEPTADAPSAKDKAHNKKQENAPPQPRAPAPLLMEFFPPGTFVRDQQYAAQALGIDYVAWWNEQRFTKDSLPTVSAPAGTGQDARVPLDVDAVLRAVREEAPRRVASP
ncbi:hypothetical protein BV20DRAFT_966417 [Pilatotrama ljubarskyi]|nr:hypothetical protein BV20DRAFT_966417 [Pilatotrama ljubarskyi]